MCFISEAKMQAPPTAVCQLQFSSDYLKNKRLKTRTSENAIFQKIACQIGFSMDENRVHGPDRSNGFLDICKKLFLFYQILEKFSSSQCNISVCLYLKN